MKEVVRVTDVMGYEQYGFTNCVKLGGLLYLSGISALGTDGMVLAGGIVQQTAATFENIRRILRAGGSDLNHIVQMTSFVVDLPKNGSGYVRARQDILSEPTYTSATIGVVALYVPGLLLEVQCCAEVAT